MGLYRCNADFNNKPPVSGFHFLEMLVSNIVLAQVGKMATTFGLEGDPRELVDVLKATAFRGEVTDAQMAALLVVANQYGLNPWTKEIYAFPDKQNGIVPVVGVDGWSRIINDNPDFDGMEFRQAEEMVEMKGAKSTAPAWMEIVIYRKSRSRPIIIREYLDEVYREPFKGKFGDVVGPWQTHPKRFLRHKTMIQGARIAFGFGGIFDQDEADRIIEGQTKDMGAAEVVTGQRAEPANAAILSYYESDEAFQADLKKWRAVVAKGKGSMHDALARTKTRYTLTPEQEAEFSVAPAAATMAPKADVQDVQPKAAADPFVVENDICAAETLEQIDVASQSINNVADPVERQRLTDMYQEMRQMLQVQH